MPVFVDTNVLVYARDTSDRDKHRRARDWMTDLWESGSGRLSMQVLEEYYVTVTRKLRPGLAKNDARDDVEDLLAWGPLVIDARALEAAWSVEQRFGLSFWNALVAGAAILTGCEHLLTEDLQDGMQLESVTVVNPFGIEAGALP